LGINQYETFCYVIVIGGLKLLAASNIRMQQLHFRKFEMNDRSFATKHGQEQTLYHVGGTSSGNTSTYVNVGEGKSDPLSNGSQLQ
jgi:hypothetical protein